MINRSGARSDQPRVAPCDTFSSTCAQTATKEATRDSAKKGRERMTSARITRPRCHHANSNSTAGNITVEDLLSSAAAQQSNAPINHFWLSSRSERRKHNREAKY